MRGLKDKIAIVAGGGSGIGAATATRLAEEGASVIIGDLNGDNAQTVAARIVADGGQAIGKAFDISEDSSVAALVACAVETYGGLDHIHANAADMQAVKGDTDAVTIPLDLFDRTIAVNLRGHMLCARHAIPEMVKRGGGAVIFTSSGAAFAGEPARVAYAISKAGLGALVRHIASRWGQKGIRANAVAPGMVLSDYVLDTLTPERLDLARKATRSKRLGQPQDLGAMVSFLMSEDGEWVNGQVLCINGGTIMR